MTFSRPADPRQCRTAPTYITSRPKSSRNGPRGAGRCATYRRPRQIPGKSAPGAIIRPVQRLCRVKPPHGRRTAEKVRRVTTLGNEPLHPGGCTRRQRMWRFRLILGRKYCILSEPSRRRTAMEGGLAGMWRLFFGVGSIKRRFRTATGTQGLCLRSRILMPQPGILRVLGIIDRSLP